MRKEELTHRQEDVDNFHNVCINNSSHPHRITLFTLQLFCFKVWVFFLATQSLNKDFCVN